MYKAETIMGRFQVDFKEIQDFFLFIKWTGSVPYQAVGIYRQSDTDFLLLPRFLLSILRITDYQIKRLTGRSKKMINKKVSAIVVAGVLVVGAAFSVFAATHGRPGNNSGDIGMEMNREGSDSGTGMNRGSRGSGGSDHKRPPAPPQDSNSRNRMPGGPGGLNGQGEAYRARRP